MLTELKTKLAGIETKLEEEHSNDVPYFQLRLAFNNICIDSGPHLIYLKSRFFYLYIYSGQDQDIQRNLELELHLLTSFYDNIMKYKA